MTPRRLLAATSVAMLTVPTLSAPASTAPGAALRTTDSRSASEGAERSDGIRLLGEFRSRCLERYENGRCRFRARGGAMAFEGRRFVTQGGLPGFGSFRMKSRAPYVGWQSAYLCFGSGHSVSLWHGFVIQSIRGNQDVSTKSCNNTDDSAGKQGLRIIDARDPLRPRQIKFLETNCGSWDHSFFPVGRIIYIYDVHDLPVCPQSRTDPEPLYMRVFKLDPEHPRRARLVSEPDSARTEACNRLFVHVERALLACTSLNRVVLFDLSDPVNPEPLGVVAIKDVVDLVGESSFSWDGDHLLVAGDCDLIVIDVSDPTAPVEAARLAATRANGACTRSVSVLPAKDPDVRLAIIGWGGAGLSIVDFSDPAAPVERDYYAEDIDWAYWYNGRIYAWTQSRKPRGLVLKLEGAGRQTMHFFNRFTPHTQFEDFR